MNTEFKSASRIRDFQRAGLAPAAVYATAKVGHLVTAMTMVTMTPEMIRVWKEAEAEYDADPVAGDAKLVELMG